MIEVVDLMSGCSWAFLDSFRKLWQLVDWRLIIESRKANPETTLDHYLKTDHWDCDNSLMIGGRFIVCGFGSLLLIVSSVFCIPCFIEGEKYSTLLTFPQVF